MTHRVAKKSAVIVLVVLVAIALVPAFSAALGGQSGLLPPNANFCDKSFNYTVTTIESQLDGEVLLEGLASDLDTSSFGPVVLAEPIYYAEPQPRGPGLNAIAAVFVFGTVSVYNPLAVGEDTLFIDVQNPILGNYHTTYHITVSPK